MKNLDKNEVYDLTGITEEQAKELLEWLKDNDNGWEETSFQWLMGDTSLRWIKKDIPLLYPKKGWATDINPPTTHISTLFEKSYEEKLQEAKKQLERYKKEVERLGNESKPKVGDVCKFWDYIESDFVIGILTDIDGADDIYEVSRSTWSENAKKLTEQEVINLLFNKS